MRLLPIRWCKDQGISLHDAGTAAAIQKKFAVGSVIQEKGLVCIPTAEVAPQKRQHAVFWLDFCAQNAAVVGESHEATELFQLTG